MPGALTPTEIVQAWRWGADFVKNFPSSGLGAGYIKAVTAPLSHIPVMAAGAVSVTLPFCDIPFLFIPGVKTDMDMMRGEETECMGLGLTEPCAVVLPGTHNKVILFDGRYITDFMTMMSGETIAAIKNHTILSQSLPCELPKTFDGQYLQEGAAMTRQYGLTSALFRVRSLAKFCQVTQEQLSSFYVGAVLQSDAQAVSAFAGDCPVYVGGKEPLQAELCLLIPNAKPLAQATMASAVGAKRIYEAK